MIPISSTHRIDGRAWVVMVDGTAIIPAEKVSATQVDIPPIPREVVRASFAALRKEPPHV